MSRRFLNQRDLRFEELCEKSLESGKWLEAIPLATLSEISSHARPFRSGDLDFHCIGSDRCGLAIDQSGQIVSNYSSWGEGKLELGWVGFCESPEGIPVIRLSFEESDSDVGASSILYKKLGGVANTSRAPLYFARGSVSCLATPSVPKDGSSEICWVDFSPKGQAMLGRILNENLLK